MLPEPLRIGVVAALRASGDSSPLRSVKRVSGGYANPAARLDTDQGSYFLKWDERGRPGMFPAEARGLALLRQVGAFRVPAVLAATDPVGSVPGFLLEEWVEAADGEANPKQGWQLGEKLAALHQTTASWGVSAYGLDHDNFVGNSPQRNAWKPDWVSFYRDQRLRPQIELADRLGLLPPERRRSLEWLMDRLEGWLGGGEERPSLLHGDLWQHNVLFDHAGSPVLIDPAVCWGEREFDLATMDIYLPAPAGFHEAYQSAWPTPSGFPERRDLHHLYLLLCCLTEGEEFGSRVDEVVRRYVG